MPSRATQAANRWNQSLLGALAVVGVASICFYFRPVLGFRIPALLLLLVVSILAMVFDMLPVLLAAGLSALILNFFFIPPLFTFHIENSEDTLLFFMYFFVAMVNATLSIRIRDREKKIRGKEEADRLLQLYNSLLNSLSHELKTPVATIVGAVDTLKENRDLLSVQQRDSLLSQMEVASLRLNREVENLLDMSRLQADMVQLRLDWCDLADLLHAVHQKLDPGIPSHPVDIHVQEDMPLIRADERLLVQVMYNLLSNACIHTPEGTPVYLEAFMEGEKVILQVKDLGPGLSREEQSRVFQLFYRTPSARPGGTGLGLPIAQGFIQAHGGTIQLSSVPGRGTIFRIELPVAVSYLKNLKHE